jgi:hypothetical protein
MDTAQLIQSVRDGDYPQVATAVAIPAGHRALTVTPGVVWWRYGAGWDQGENIEVTTTSHDARRELDLQGRRDLNSQPSVLETGALPIELLPFATPEGVGEPASLPEAATRPEAECSIRQPAAPFSVGGQVQAEAAAGRDRRDRAAINTPPVTPAAVAATIPPT